MQNSDPIDPRELIDHTSMIVTAFVSNNVISTNDVPELIAKTHAALAGLSGEQKPEFEPAVDPKKSIKPDGIISLIDGKKYKMLKRHLNTHGLTPEEYIERYGLPANYPMVSAEYAEARRKLALKIGLGRKAR